MRSERGRNYEESGGEGRREEGLLLGRKVLKGKRDEGKRRREGVKSGGGIREEEILLEGGMMRDGMRGSNRGVEKEEEGRLGKEKFLHLQK